MGSIMLSSETLAAIVVIIDGLIIMAYFIWGERRG